MTENRIVSGWVRAGQIWLTFRDKLIIRQGDLIPGIHVFSKMKVTFGYIMGEHRTYILRHQPQDAKLLLLSLSIRENATAPCLTIC